MNRSILILIVLFGTCLLSAEDGLRMTDIEDDVREALGTKGKVAFFELFYSPAGEAREMEMRRDIKEMFERHFQSGHGEVIVVPPKGDDYRKETMGWLSTDGLRRAPGPPFAYLELYPSDENDPDYQGLSMRLSRIDGEVRIVYPELQTEVPEHLSGKLTRWRRADETEFWAQFLGIEDDKVLFRNENFESLKIDLEDLSQRDRERAVKLTAKAKKTE